jgi:hypothetical protein
LCCVEHKPAIHRCSSCYQSVNGRLLHGQPLSECKGHCRRPANAAACGWCPVAEHTCNRMEGTLSSACHCLYVSACEQKLSATFVMCILTKRYIFGLSCQKCTEWRPCDQYARRNMYNVQVVQEHSLIYTASMNMLPVNGSRTRLRTKVITRP